LNEKGLFEETAVEGWSAGTRLRRSVSSKCVAMEKDERQEDLPKACCIDDLFRVIRHHLRRRQLILYTGVLDATKLGDAIEVFALECTKGGSEGRSHVEPV
jgi:hypothetical protein